MIISNLYRSNTYLEFLRKILSVLQPERKKEGRTIVLLTFLNALSEVIGLAMIIPVIYLINDPAPIYDNAILNKIFVISGISSERMFIFALILMLVIVFIVKNVFSVFVYHQQNKFAFAAASDLTDRQLKAHFNFSLLRFRDKNSNFIARDVAKMPFDFAHLVMVPFLRITSEYFVLTMIIIGLASFDLIILLLLALTIIPIIFMIDRFTRKRAKNLGELKNSLEPAAFKSVYESVHSFADIKLFNKQNFFKDRIVNNFKSLFNSYLWIYTYQRMPIRILESIVILAILVIYGSVIILFNGTNERILMVLLLFATAAYRMMPSLNDILSSVILMRSASYVFDLVEPEGQMETETSRPVSGSNKLEGDLVFDKVSFTYPEANQKALDEIDLRIVKGTSTGIIGASGSGKTTIGKLILKLIDENDGRILINGQDIGDASTWYNSCGYVQQDFHILDLTLAENIAFGEALEEIDHQKLKKVISQVQLEELVNSLDEGYLSGVGEFGTRLAGGHKQRIAIARALYKGVELLVLDEATSALDQPLENDIISMLDDLVKEGLTVVIISHRLNALKRCKLIYELENGRIKGEHQFAHLMSE